MGDTSIKILIENYDGKEGYVTGSFFYQNIGPVPFRIYRRALEPAIFNLRANLATFHGKDLERESIDYLFFNYCLYTSILHEIEPSWEKSHLQ